MSDTTATLRRKIGEAGDLRSVVRTMKAVAASNIGQYEQSVKALIDYYRTVEMGLGACLRESRLSPLVAEPTEKTSKTTVMINAVVFGSDQGLVGQFNDQIADFAFKTLATLSKQPTVWAVGERIQVRLLNAGLQVAGLYAVPSSVNSISSLVGQILIESQNPGNQRTAKVADLHIFFNRPTSDSGYAPFHQRLLPLDESWRNKLLDLHWPKGSLPEVMGVGETTLHALIREYLFVSLFRACAESLASENASRLAAMQRADKNIDDLLNDLNGKFHRLRQSSIDEELFDVVAGFEALSAEKP